jgi:hypothetical protein
MEDKAVNIRHTALLTELESYNVVVPLGRNLRGVG